MIENKTTSDCTIYAFVGTAILAISLVVAMYVGNDFHQSMFVESIIFVGSNILLWAIFISMVNCPYELMTIGSNSKTKKNVVEAEPATEQEQPKQTLPQTESAQYSHEDYAKCVEAQEKEAQEIKEKRTRAVLDYVHRTMSRFLYEEDLYKVIEAVKEWSNDTNYTPIAINRFKETVENIPLSNHTIFRHANFIGCLSADKIKMPVRKYFCFNIPVYRNMAEEPSCRSPYHEEYIQTSVSGNSEGLCRSTYSFLSERR